MKHVIILPDLGQTTSEAKVLQWHKRVGEKVDRGEPILEVETDKVDMDVESYVEGYLRKTLVPEGEMATALEPVAILTDTPEEDFVEGEEPKEPTNGAETAVASTPDTAQLEPKRPSGAAVAPAARRLAKEFNVDLSEVTGTGPDGLIIRRDIKAYVDRQPATGGAGSPARSLAAMAAITVESKKQIPHFYATRQLDLEGASQWRADWNAQHPEAKATYNDLFVRAALKALHDVPRFNLVVRDGTYEQRETADILLVVAEEESLSLIPVADACGLAWPEFLQQMRKAISDASAPVAAESRKSIRPALAVSNLGMHQVDTFSAIIPPGCTAALAIGSVAATPVVEQGRVAVRQRCSVTMSADHRVVDGVAVARFLERMQHHLNDLG